MKQFNVRTISFTLMLIFIILFYFGYTFYSDAEAIRHIRVEISSIDSIEPKLTSATLTFTINITNPTPHHIHNLSATFDMYIESNYIGDGSFSDISIESHSTSFKQMMVKIYYKGLADAAVDYIRNRFQGEDTPFTLQGTMKSSTLFGISEVTHQFNASIENP